MRTIDTRLLPFVLIAFGLSACGDQHDHHSHESSDNHDAVADHDAHASGDHEENHHDGDHDDHISPGEVGESADAGTVRQIGAHLHGDAKLAIALENNTLFIEFETPVYNLTGFEYAPATAEERAAVKTAEQQLASPGTLFELNAEADCRAAEVNPKLTFDDDHSDDHSSDHDDHSEDGHDDEHDKDGHEEDHHAHEDHGKDSHDKDHEGHDGDHAKEGHDDDHSSEHRDTRVTYQFRCGQPARLTAITVRLFEAFPRLEALDAIYLDDDQQLSKSLSPSDNTLNLKR